MSDGYPVTIEQLAGSRLRLDLDAADLPDQDVEAPIEQRVKRWYLPGSVEPTTHVMGPSFRSLTLRGEFSDAATYTEGHALAQASILSRMVAEGVPVRLTWGDTLDREGLLDSGGPVYARSTLIGWRLVFTPQTVADVNRRQGVASTTSAALSDASLELDAVAAAMTARLDAALASTWLSTL